MTRPISRLAVSLAEASQSAQMRFSTYFALSSSGAALSASNSRSRFCVLSPCCARGSVARRLDGLERSRIQRLRSRRNEAANERGDRQGACDQTAAHGRNLALQRGTLKTRFWTQYAHPTVVSGAMIIILASLEGLFPSQQRHLEQGRVALPYLYPCHPWRALKRRWTLLIT